MCGIAAVLMAPKVRSLEQWQAIWQHFTDNLRVNEARGAAATGVAIAQHHGSVQVHKQPIAASDFAQTAEYAALQTHLTAQTVLLLGHTRHPTQGTPDNNLNNHPLQTRYTVGIHNGHIANSEALFETLHLPRDGDVDSEVIFRLLDTLPRSPVQVSRVASVLRSLQGRFTILAMSPHNPAHLLIVKHQNPLSLHFHPDWEALLFSSSYLFLRKAFGPAVAREVVPNDQVLLFDANQLASYHDHPTAHVSLF